MVLYRYIVRNPDRLSLQSKPDCENRRGRGLSRYEERDERERTASLAGR
jgi:hypothetical protein